MMESASSPVGSLPFDNQASEKTFSKALDLFILRRTLYLYIGPTVAAIIIKLVLKLEDDIAVRRLMLILVILKYTPTRWLPYVNLSGGPNPVQIARWGTICADLRYVCLDTSPLWLLETLRWILFNFKEALTTSLTMFAVGITLLLAYIFTPKEIREAAFESYTELDSQVLTYRETIIVWVDDKIRLWISSIHQQEQKNTMEGSSFIHKPLEGYIRLLKLRRRLPFRPISCTLVDVRLDKAPPYVAISYTWGPEDSPSYVVCDNAPYGITKNAYHVLYSLTSVWRSKLLWIDSICIDQTNIQEKNQQILLMQDIYRRATQTVVSLGDTGDAHLAIQLLGELNIELQLHPHYEVLAKYKHEVHSSRFLALNKLVRSEWFDRVWVIQEVAMSSNIQVYYGNERLGWNELLTLLFPNPGGGTYSSVNLCQAIFPHEGIDGKLRDPMEPHHSYVMDTFRRQMQQNKKMPLFHLLYNTLSFRATKRLDNVFALQGICEEMFLRKPDYNRSDHDVFVETATDILCSTQDHRLSLLSIAGTGFGRVMTDLPSWVPEWGGGEPTTSSLTNPGFTRDVSVYDFEAHGTSTQDISFGADPEILILGGLHVDEILVIGEEPLLQLDTSTVTDSSKLLENYQKLIRWTDEAWELSQLYALSEYPTEQPLIEAFWRTCMGDRLISPSGVVRPAPSEYHSYFRAALRVRPYVSSLHLLVQAEPDSPEQLAHARVLAMGFGSLQLGGLEKAIECNRIAQEFEAPMFLQVHRRRFCVTSEGYIGLVPANARVGDRISIIHGAQTPYVLRQVELEESDEEESEIFHELVGECYFHGMMDGEMVTESAVTQKIAIR
ncbi:HET-domain-containing protein [Cadophora sp. DSE1049]|nr:HET-domain-containing protein [Cadophora sp. DSE1049]